MCLSEGTDEYSKSRVDLPWTNKRHTLIGRCHLIILCTFTGSNHEPDSTAKKQQEKGYRSGIQLNHLLGRIQCLTAVIKGRQRFRQYKEQTMELFRKQSGGFFYIMNDICLCCVRALNSWRRRKLIADRTLEVCPASANVLFETALK